MIKTRIRKILRDVWARKGRTLLVSAAIFIGVAGTIALFSMSDIIVSQLEEDIKEEELAMAQMAITGNPDIQLNNALYLQILQNHPELPGITSVMGGMEDNPVSFKVQPGDEDFEDATLQAYAIWNGDPDNPQLIPVFGKEDDQEYTAPIEPLRLLEGSYPTDDPAQKEIAVEKRMADKFDLSVGQTIYFRPVSASAGPMGSAGSASDDSPDGSDDATAGDGLDAWTISGIVFDAYALTPDSGVYTTLDKANYLAGRTGFDNIWVRFNTFSIAEDEYDTLQRIVSTLGNEENRVKGIDQDADSQPYTIVFSELQDPKNSPLIMQAQQISNLMGALALMALIVSGFLVVNVITSLVVEQRRQIGVMKSIGATRLDNFLIYSGIAFAYGVIGVIPGVLVGIPGGDAAADALAPELNTLLGEGFNYSPFSILLGVVIGLLVPVIASIIPVFNGTRVQILDAMTDLGIDANYGSGPIAKLIERLPIPITIRQGLSNVSLKKSRLAFTVLTLAIAAGAFMGIFAIFESFTGGISSYIDTFNIDIAIGPLEARDPDEFEAIMRENFQTADTNYIDTVEPLLQLQVKFEGYDPGISPFGPPGIFAFGYDVESSTPGFNFEIDEGAGLNAENKDTGIIFSSALANHMEVEVDDSVGLKLANGVIKKLTVVGISEFPIDQAWIHWETLADAAGYSYDTIIRPSAATDQIYTALEPGNGGSAPRIPYLEYASYLTVDGYESASDQPGTLVLGLTSRAEDAFAMTGGDFFAINSDVEQGPQANGVIISRAIADKGDYEVGQTLELTSLSPLGQQIGPFLGAETEYEIVGIFAPPDRLVNPMLPADFIGMYAPDLELLDGFLPIPVQAADFIKYATYASADGYSGMLPGNMVPVMGLTPRMSTLLPFGPDDGSFFAVSETAAAGEPQANGVVISRGIQEQGGYTVGDTITLTPLGETDPQEYEIVGVFDTPDMLAQGTGVEFDFVGMFWRDLTLLDGAKVSSKPRPQFYSIITPLEDPSADELDDIINDINDTLAAKSIPTFSLNFVDLTNQILQAFTIIQTILSAVAFLIAIVGALGLLTTLSMSVYERQKEIGVMRSIGAGSTTIALQFLTEGLVVGVIAWLVGIPLMLLTQFVLLEVVNARDLFPMEFSLTATLIGLAGMLVITTLASLWPSIAASRKTVSDILRYQ
jgi:ABC-type antimicrobial peptide transport system permease subunit